ncbi:MAG: DUF2231 domain-containing protein [Rhodothermales bacterium]
MLPDPLHPAVVHMPIAMAVLAPVLVLVALVLIRKTGSIVAPWLPVVVVALMMGGSAYMALETGEDEEDRVEQVVSRDAIHEHEERAELFLWSAVVLAVVALGGLLKGKWGSMFRWTALAVCLVALVLAVRVGGSGGELVYDHGAASAYVE